MRRQMTAGTTVRLAVFKRLSLFHKIYESAWAGLTARRMLIAANFVAK